MYKKPCYVPAAVYARRLVTLKWAYFEDNDRTEKIAKARKLLI